MGNACFCEQAINYNSDQVLIKDNDKLNTKKKLKSKNKMNELLNYFNESEKEIINNLKKKDKGKKIPSKKKLEFFYDTKDNNQHELMLKRLLEQQNIKKNGPKRRETIRGDGNKINDLVQNLLIENKNQNVNNNNNENNTLLISNQVNKKGRLSVNVDRNALFMNNLNNKKKKLQEQYLKNRKTICGVIGETKGYIKKE